MGMIRAETPSLRTWEADEAVHHSNKDSASNKQGVVRQMLSCVHEHGMRETVLDEDTDVNPVPLGHELSFFRSFPLCTSLLPVFKKCVTAHSHIVNG